LYEEEKERNPQQCALLVRHGVELARFNPERALQAGQPPDLVNIKRPIVGFFGDIDDELVDMKLVGATAYALPEVSFVFVGRFIADPSPIRGLPNVHFVGKKPYEEVPQYGMQFDVAIMPFKRNRWIHYCNPIKLKEYLALGLPVVSTDFPEALHYQDVIFLAHTGEDFVRGIREALGGEGVGNAESRRARVAGDTWEQAALHIAETIRKRANERSSRQYLADLDLDQGCRETYYAS
jgi:glycosyltransferase involved in cell wall biosynthesis